MKLILATSTFCGPCSLIKRRIQDENLQVEIVNMEEQPEKFKQFGVRSVPRLVVLENNEVVEIIQGSDDIIKKIKQNAQDQKVS